MAPRPFLHPLTWHSLYDLLLQNKEPKQYNTILSSNLKATSDTYLKISSLLHDCIHPPTSLYPPSQSVMLWHLFLRLLLLQFQLFCFIRQCGTICQKYLSQYICILPTIVIYINSPSAVLHHLFCDCSKILHTIWRKEMYAVSVHDFPLSFFSFSLSPCSFSPYVSHPPSLSFAVMLSLSFCSPNTALFWLQIF